jgi:hypothetical protein
MTIPEDIRTILQSITHERRVKRIVRTSARRRRQSVDRMQDERNEKPPHSAHPSMTGEERTSERTNQENERGIKRDARGL